ncbi:MAG: DUF2298 domain-containing protein [Lachnospiraceae bacterium]|nr:DUF2298 domain-containing protein [Lachnospiraceae bacterium]
MTSIFIWWAVITLIGIGFMPLTNILFGKFEDRGWLFSKVIGLFISGYLMFLLSSVHAMRFTATSCIILVCLCVAVNVAILVFWKKGSDNPFQNMNYKLIIIEEILFLLLFLMWCYLVGFKPGAYGTEKFMDYGFMTSMMRSDYMAPKDMWYAGSNMNYYYGGQYYATFLTKLSGVTVGEGYNLMRTMISAFSFMLPFSIVYQLLESLQQNYKEKVRKWISGVGGVISGLAVSMCGNVHYIIFGIIYPILEKITGKDLQDDFWFPDSTRYIGYNPEVGDKTIHEFPSYSSILGDLHAHFVNILFIMIVLGIMLSWALKQETKWKALPRRISRESRRDRDWRAWLREGLLIPEVWMLGFLTGMFRFTNFWDFPIYFVVGGSVVFFVNLKLYRGNGWKFWFITVLQAVEVLIIGYIAALPFTLTFEKISSQVLLTHSHTAFYQLLVLWGLPTVTVLGFIAMLILNYRRKRKNVEMEQRPGAKNADETAITNGKIIRHHSGRRRHKEWAVVRFLRSLGTADLFMLILGVCAMGLILMPEVIYVKDIYSDYRANTMFKLTYQGYMLFGISMAYIFIRTLLLGKKPAKILSCCGLFILALTLGYFFKAVDGQFGNVLDTSRYKGIDASVFVEDSFNSDLDAITWLNENVEGQPTILEANGDSYSANCRVSVATGLPTVLGWYVHEWLWRNNTDAENVRVADIETIYTSTDAAAVQALLDKYDISYVYIGTQEREKFPALNDTLLQSLGTVAYSNGIDTYIMQMP